MVLNQLWIKSYEYVFLVIFLALNNREEQILVECRFEFFFRGSMLSIKCCLMITFCIFLQMSIKKRCSFPKHIQYGTSIMLDRKHIPAEALKLAKSEYGMQDMRQNLCSGCTTFLTRSTFKVSLIAPFNQCKCTCTFVKSKGNNFSTTGDGQLMEMEALI